MAVSTRLNEKIADNEFKGDYELIVKTSIPSVRTENHNIIRDKRHRMHSLKGTNPIKPGLTQSIDKNAVNHPDANETRLRGNIGPDSKHGIMHKQYGAKLCFLIKYNNSANNSNASKYTNVKQYIVDAYLLSSSEKLKEALLLHFKKDINNDRYKYPCSFFDKFFF